MATARVGGRHARPGPGGSDAVRAGAYEGVVPDAPKRSSMDPQLPSLLERHREDLLRAALKLAVSRSTLADLANRPLAERLAELELVFEAAGARRVTGGRDPRTGELQTELARQLDEHEHARRPLSVAVIAAGSARIGRLGEERRATGPDGRAWARALRDAAEPEDVVIDAGDGATAILLPDHGAREARVVVERLCRAAWRALGEEGPLAGAGIATHPDDGASTYEVLAAAYDRLWRQADVSASAAEPDEHDAPAAPVHPLRPV